MASGVMIVVALFGWASCGSNQSQPTGGCDQVDWGCNYYLAITASNAAVKILGSINLQGETHDFVDPGARWWVNESLLQNRLYCTFTSQSQNNAQACPFGYIVYNGSQPPYTATYYAPQNPGTYHIAFSANPPNDSGTLLVLETITVVQ